MKKVKVLVTQSCPTLCDPKDCSLPGSCVHGISQARTGFLQARILEWLPCPPPGDLPDPGIEPTSLCLLHWQVGSLPLAPPGKGQAKWRAQCSLESRPAPFLLLGLPPALLQPAGILSCLHLISLFSLSHLRSLSDPPRPPTPTPPPTDGEPYFPQQEAGAEFLSTSALTLLNLRSPSWPARFLVCLLVTLHLFWAEEEAST